MTEKEGRVRPVRIAPVRIEFHDDRTPYSPQFQDVYFSPVSGLDESSYVYLEGGGLASRLSEWASKPSHPGSRVTVAEIGFGVGLNFLLTLREFKKIALPGSPPGAALNYFSFEKHPVVREDLERLYAAYPELREEADALLLQYPVLTPGIHLLKFCGGRVRLYLGLGDAHELLPRTDFRADHWYWDGFAPSRNPDAFSENLCAEIARHSAPGARGASFTSAGWVRRALEAAGFQIEKRPGFGKKRECIAGVLAAPAEETRRVAQRSAFDATSAIPPWFSGEGQKRLLPGDRVAILGAGLAGSAIAHALAGTDVDITIFDPHGIAQRASGNPVGLFNTQISKHPTPMSRFSQSGLVHLLAELDQIKPKTRHGILRTDSQDPSPLESSDYPADFHRVTERGLFFPRCGMLDPRELCTLRIAASGARFVPREVRGIERPDTAEGAFRLDFDHSGVDESVRGGIPEFFDHVIHAGGADGKGTLPEALPTRAIRGQVILVRPTSASRLLESVLVEEGYASPLAPELTGGEEFHLIGATYQARTVEPNQEELDIEALIQDAHKWPEFAGLSREQLISTRAGYRLSTPDKLPLIGPLCDPLALEKNYARALRGGKFDLSALPPLPASPGEWMLTGLGSRGVTTSTLCGEILAAMMLGQPLPIELDLLEHLHSARFFIRNLRKTTVK